MSDFQGKPLSKAERLARLRLSLSQNVGPITFRQLIVWYGSGEKALAILPELAKRGGSIKRIRICTKDKAEDLIASVKAAGAFITILGDEVYPVPLAATEGPPPFMVAKGHKHLLEKKTIAIVGARNASANGQRFAREIAARLGEEGFVIASGLARGIDTHAHLGGLETGTIAVLGGGIDVYYPKENQSLQEKIAETGLLLSEHPLGTKPQAQHFPRRNRIISGLSVGVVVVEAALRSGSLITARLALEQGREVFAVPGHPMDPRAKGPNSLIRSSALLIESADDILEVLNSSLKTPLSDPAMDMFEGLENPEETGSDIEAYRKQVRQMLGPAPTQIDDLIRTGSVPTAILFTILLELELAGLAKRHPGNKVSLV